MKRVLYCDTRSMTRLRQILFVPPAPLVWARHLDLFATHGIDVETTQTLSSDQLGQGLADGTWDIGIAVVDNVIAWNDERRANLRIIAQLERSTVMAFCGLPRYRSLAEAAADPIAVDSTTNGFVLVLYRALARAGIDWRACRFDPVGGVRQRLRSARARQRGRDDPRPALHRSGARAGFTKLWSGDQVAPAYPGVVVAARADWLDATSAMQPPAISAPCSTANVGGDPGESGRRGRGASSRGATRHGGGAGLVRDVGGRARTGPCGWDEWSRCVGSAACCSSPSRARRT